MKVSSGQSLILLLISLSSFACNSPSGKPARKAPEVTVATVPSQAVTLSDQYVCQIRAHHFVDIRALEVGYIDAIQVKEGQEVKQGDLLFRINSKKLFKDKVSPGGVLPFDPILEKAKADANTAAVAFGVVPVNAPFDGIAGSVPHQVGELVRKGETLTTLSDNDQICAYFHVSEAKYLEHLDQRKDDLKIELVLANNNKFNQTGHLAAIGSNFNTDTGTVAFRADFPNPDHLLRHGQSGTLLISHVQKDAIVVPQRATFEVNGKRYVYVVDNSNRAHEREIIIQTDQDTLFVVKEGLSVGEKIIVEGALLVRDGEQVEPIVQSSKPGADLKHPVD